MSKKKIAVIGLGSIGSRHARNLVRLGHEVYGYDPGIVAGVPGVKMHSDPITLPEADAYVIASPTSTHANYIFRFGAKPLFVEKPIADRLIIITDEWAGSIAMVGYNLRFHSCVLAAKDWIDGGHIGTPQWANLVCAQRNDKPAYLRDGVILNWSHEIDLALHLLGPAELVECVADDKETMADLILVHDNGCQSTIHLDYLTRPEIRQSIIVGSDATIIMDLAHRHAWLRKDHLQAPISVAGDDSFDSNYLDEMETFIARIDGQETIGCTGSEGLEVLKICLEAKRLAGVGNSEKQKLE